MKEQIHTIPIADAFAEQGECPFCYIEKRAEMRIMDFVLGSSASYMEADMRERTDRAGFCRSHFKKMYDYGNSLGNAWILKTHHIRMIQEMNDAFKDFKPNKPSLRERFRKDTTKENAIVAWAQQKEDSCYICNSLKETFDSYMGTFFTLYKNEEDFRKLVAQSKGFCITHFGDLCAAADTHLHEKELNDFYDMVLPLMQKNMDRLLEDVSWYVEKFDYRNKDADWKDSKDAVERGMQKLKGGYPADSAYVMKK